MTTLASALVAAVVVAAGYFFCLRPMSRGHCVMMGSRQNAELDRQIADLCEELRVLRAQDSLYADQSSRNRPDSPSGS